MRHIATTLLIVTLGVAGLYAQDPPVSMTFSGTSTSTTLVVHAGTSAGVEDFAGNGSLGPFTYHELQAGSVAPVASSTCAGPALLDFPIEAGAGVFRFQDGSLLTVRITAGATCVDLTVPVGRVAVTYQVTGGTGRFQNASGALTLTATSNPVLFTDANAPVLFAVTGDVSGTITF